MPYDSIIALYDSIRNVLPAHTQEIFKEAFNNSWDQYEDPEKRRDDADREEIAHRIAWSAVKQ
jgi:cation transport regulator